MKYLILIIPFIASCSIFQNTPDELVASKCRLKLPIQKEQCIAVGIHPSRIKGGQLEGLPVTRLNED